MYKNFKQMFLAWASTSQEKGNPAHMLRKLMCDDPCLYSRVHIGSLWLIERLFQVEMTKKNPFWYGSYETVKNKEL